MRNIYGLSLSSLETYLENIGENKAKAKIIFKAIYRDKIKDFSKLNNINSTLIEKLKSDFRITLPTLIDKSIGDNVVKLLFSLEDKNLIEAVLMKQKYGNSVCVSTQIGCNMGCKFCESGKNRKLRNLTAYEIIGQIMYIMSYLGEEVKTVAIMGIGEPFDNYEEVIKFIDIAREPYGLAIGNRHITVSSCGIVDKIYDYAKRETVNSLAISLHAPNDDLRSQLMPINKKYNLDKLIKAVKFYNETTKRKVFFEYVMLKGVNDSLDSANKLADLLLEVNCTVNLIPYNETSALDFKRSEFENIMEFYKVLRDRGIHATIRREFGDNINAACGQLKSQHKCE